MISSSSVSLFLCVLLVGFKKVGWMLEVEGRWVVVVVVVVVLYYRVINIEQVLCFVMFVDGLLKKGH